MFSFNMRLFIRFCYIAPTPATNFRLSDLLFILVVCSNGFLYRLSKLFFGLRFKRIAHAYIPPRIYGGIKWCSYESSHNRLSLSLGMTH